MEQPSVDRQLGAEAVAAPAAGSAPAIEISDLRKDYNGFLAVDGLNLTVPQGSFFGFLGPNGAGKTTTIKMLTGLIAATGGRASIFGEPVPNPRAMAKVGFLPENPYVYPYLTPREFVTLCGRLNGVGGPHRKQRPGDLMRGGGNGTSRHRCGFLRCGRAAEPERRHQRPKRAVGLAVGPFALDGGGNRGGRRDVYR